MPPPAHSDNRSGKSKHLLANFDLALAEVFSILDHYRVQKPMAPQHDSLTVSPKTYPQNHLAQRRLWICQNFPAPGDWRVVKRVFASRRSRRILCWENSFILCIVERACSLFPVPNSWASTPPFGVSRLRALLIKTAASCDFGTNSRMPIKRACRSMSLSPNALYIMSGTEGISRLSIRAASSPFMTGMERSINLGRSWWAFP